MLRVDASHIAIFPSVRRAQLSDAAALADLVNRAYAIEGFFVDGLSTELRATFERRSEYLELQRRRGVAVERSQPSGPPSPTPP